MTTPNTQADKSKSVINTLSDPTADSKPMYDLSYSSNGELETCPRKYQIRKRFIQPKHSWEDGLAARGGQAIHEYIQTRLLTNDVEQARMAFFYAFNFNAEEEATSYTRDNRGFEACLHSAEATFADLNIDPTELAWFDIAGERKPGIEVKFEIVFRSENWNNDYRYRGAIDTVLYTSFFKRYKGIDYKTHRDYKMLSSDNQDHKFKYNEQLVPYGLVVEHLAGRPTDQFMEFDTDYHSIFIDIHKPDHRCYSFKRTSVDVQNWYERTVDLIERMDRYSQRAVWPRTGRGCESWGKPCAFFNKCDIEDPEEMQDRLLNYGEWEPQVPKPFNPWITLYLDV